MHPTPARLVAAFLAPAALLHAANITVAPPGADKDAVPLLQAALEKCRGEKSSVITLKPGVYDMFTDRAVVRDRWMSNTTTDDRLKAKHFGLWLEGLKNITLRGPGATLVLRGKMCHLGVEKCENITFDGLAFDMKRPSMSEYTVVSREGNSCVVKVHPDSTYAIRAGRVVWIGEGWETSGAWMAQEYDPKKDTTWRSHNPVHEAKSAVEVSPGVIRLTFDKPAQGEPGRVFQARETVRDHVGAFIHQSKDTVFRDTSFYYLHGFGILGQFSENIAFERAWVAPRKGSGRTAAGYADFLHFSGCSGKIIVKDSFFAGPHDDHVNVHGTHLRIVDRPAPDRIKVRFMHNESAGFEAFFPGDTLDFVHSASLAIFGSAKVISAVAIDKNEVLLSLAGPVPEGIAKDDCVENATRTAAVELRGNRFTRCPTRSVLITTRQPVVIENNLFTGIGMSGILFADDAASWYESGCVRDVTIAKNRFVEVAGTPVDIHPENREADRRTPVHSGFVVRDNTFTGTPLPFVRAKSTSGLRITGNTVEKPRGGDKIADLTACDAVEISGNRGATGADTHNMDGAKVSVR